ncbi:MAG: hypothetical protein KC535_06090, partial [Nanoarchaeota archaeon]|nr:hypothetical protein [Nanoarchaeota archaeon]
MTASTEKILEQAVFIRSTKYQMNFSVEERKILSSADNILLERAKVIGSLDEYIGTLFPKR